jgi:intracellular sulfur oxidation DsrE/DsrF family protein
MIHRAMIPRPARVPCPLLAMAAAALFGSPLAGQGGAEPLSTPRDGPVIHGFGAVYDVPLMDLETPLDMEYKVVFEVSQSGEPGTVNPYLNTVARFLNMHARAGVPLEKIHLAVVMHGEAAKDALMDAPFRERYGVDNANLDLLRQLSDAGVELYMCGQSAQSRGLPRDRLVEPIRMALSAMTALSILHARGYWRVN